MLIFRTTFRKSATWVVICFTASAVMCSSLTAFACAAEVSPGYYTKQELDGLISGIIGWKQETADASSATALIEEKLSADAGDFAADWYAMSIARMEPDPVYPVYLDKLQAKVADLYKTGDKENVPATDFHRIALTMIALGGDPRNIMSGTEAQRIDILSDFTYDRGLTAPLDRQGISGLLWGLITLDAMQYVIPAGSFYTRKDIILKILESQKPDGGFSLSGASADPDVTAMAVQALSPYYNDEDKYKYKRLYDGEGLEHSVREAVEIALARLSAMQKDTGDYSSWGNRNSQTGAQVMLALCSLGIDPQKDSRFIKKGVTLMDGVMLYRMTDGGFSSSYQTARSNSKSSEQILYTFIAMRRQMDGLRRLFDMRPEQNSALKEQLAGITEEISKIDATSARKVLEAIDGRYRSIPQNERFYVCNYVKLSEALKNTGNTVPSSEEASSAIAGSAVSMQDGSGFSSGETSGGPSGDFHSGISSSAVTGSSAMVQGSSSGDLSDNDGLHDSPDGGTLMIIIAAAAIILILAGTGLIYRKHKSGGKT
ncbi:MAG: prenyltransferase/squalene oxidase repeat-containing protein [Saccharofermentanales bacterium]